MADWKEFGTGLAQSAISQGASGILGALFGPSVKKQIKMQKEAQMELNRDAANINYQYGEKAAENAYKRQMQMYERSYNDQSYGAMRQQMENAGLSVGLMYGQGASGGGQGAMTGAPQGATGGAVAGNAAEQLSAAIALKQLKIQESTAMAQNAKAYAEASKLKADTGKSSAEEEQIKVRTQQARDSFEWTLENLREEAKGKWLDNNAKQFNMEIDNWDGKKKISSEKFGDLTIKARGIFNGNILNDAIENAIKKDDVEGANMLRAVEAAYKDEQTKWKAVEVYTATRLAAVAEQNAATELMKTQIQGFLAKSQVKLNDAMVTRIAQATILQAKGLELQATKAWAEIDALMKTTKFNTGAWAKARIVLEGIGSIGGIGANIMTRGAYGKAKALENKTVFEYNE